MANTGSGRYMFGLGPGHLSRRVERAAKREGGTLVNYTDAQCNCGYGCRPYTCSRSARHWFELPDGSSPREAAAVMEAAYAARTIADKQVWK